MVRFFRLVFFLLILISTSIITPLQTVRAEQYWQIQSIDTMKVSRDKARDPYILLQIPEYVEKVARLNPTHIAIDTPYDEEFYPVLATWVKEARKNHLSVWFRGNFASWEGWFGYPKFKDPKEHNAKMYEFMTKHKDLFADSDIVTPIPEPENGGFGDPRKSDIVRLEFNSLLVSSYNNCTAAAKQIDVKVLCGYYSVNGDVALESLDTQTIKQTGNVVVIDHYVETPEKMAADLVQLYEKCACDIVLGEFGAPVPDLNGDLTDAQQANLIRKFLDVFVAQNDHIKGLNYWTAFEGTTTLFSKRGSPKIAAGVLDSYYQPVILKGVVVDGTGQRVAHAIVRADKTEYTTETDKLGRYKLLVPYLPSSLTVEHSDFYTTQTAVSDRRNNTITVTPIRVSLWYLLREILTIMPPNFIY